MAENGGWDFLNNLVSAGAQVYTTTQQQQNSQPVVEQEQQTGRIPRQPMTTANPVQENPGGPLGLPLDVAGIKTEYVIIGVAVIAGILYLKK